MKEYLGIYEEKNAMFVDGNHYGVRPLPASAFCSGRDENTDPINTTFSSMCAISLSQVLEKGDDQGEYSKSCAEIFSARPARQSRPASWARQATPHPRRALPHRRKRAVLENLPPLGVSMRAIGRRLFAGPGFHSIMFGEGQINSLKGSPFRNLGRNTFRMAASGFYVEDAKWVF